jgi:glycosyltransferase involved in cell wall biosynthesis
MRAVKGLTTALKWIRSASKENEIEYIVSTDSDDSQKYLYSNWWQEQIAPRVKKFKHVSNDNKNVVDAMNAGARYSTGQVIVCVSDDFSPPDNWDELIAGAGDWTTPIALKVNDTITKESDILLTLPIISRPLYQSTGYIYYPKYTGMFADNDLAEKCQQMGCLTVRHDLIFEHNHWVNNKAIKDETYNRHNTTASWNLGTALIEKRRKEKFAA